MRFSHSVGADQLLSEGGLIRTGRWSVGMWCHWNDDHRVDEMISAESGQHYSPSLGVFQWGWVSSVAENSASTGRIALEVKEREDV